MRKGDRVQLHPATDSWMRGDRYGEIVGFGRPRLYRDTFTCDEAMERPIKVKLDKSGLVKRFRPSNLFPI